MNGIMDGQFQRINAGAAVSVGVRIRVRARCGVHYAVPCVTLTGGLGLDIVGAMVNRQLQRIDTGATVGVIIVILVNT